MMNVTEPAKAEKGVTYDLGAAADLDHLGLMLGMAPAVERRFETDTRSERIALIRLTFPVGLFIYNVYNLSDIIFARDTIAFGITLRLAVVTPLGLLLCWILPRLSARVREALYFGSMLGVYAVPILVFWWSSEPDVTYTTPEFYLVMVYVGMALPLRFPYMLAFTIIATLQACIVFALKDGLSHAIVGGLMLQVVTGGCFVIYGNYRGELTRRRSYLRTLREIARSDGLEADKTMLTNLSSSDPLTGLANRRAFDVALNAALWDRSGDSVALLIVDVDHFKRFNDTYGHVEGDRCLRAVAETLTPPSWAGRSLVARYGGEEFAILLPGLDQRDAHRAAEGVRAAIEVLALPHAGRIDGTRIVTVSIGVAATAAGAGTAPTALLQEADTALYAAKRLGRNRCAGRSRTWDGPLHGSSAAA